MFSSFMIHFLICNGIITIFISAILLVKLTLKNKISSRMQYNLWYLLTILLAVPFLPVKLPGSGTFLTWLPTLSDTAASATDKLPKAQGTDTAALVKDFSISVQDKLPSYTVLILSVTWLLGILFMVFLFCRSQKRVRRLKRSALPVQNVTARTIYEECLSDLNIKRSISLYSTAFLKSPAAAGFFSPGIYIPLQLLSDIDETQLRYIFLHELHHYKHRDSLMNYFINLYSILYWFHPIVRYALKEIHNDCEIACDESVLSMLDKEEYKVYGMTLIRFADMASHISFRITSGIGGSKKQIHKRILTIASYQGITPGMKRCGALCFLLSCIVLLGCAPVLSIHAWDDSRVSFKEDAVYEDLSSYFGDYEGSFVLYDSKEDAWNIYNKENSTKRISPASTYKIYSGLFALESGIITRENSVLAWDGISYPYDSWNHNQSLSSAMENSVTWYFQHLDEKLGLFRLKQYFNQINYGNKDLSGGLKRYWVESSLKISAVEQVDLLRSLHNNKWGFSTGSIETIMDSMLLSSLQGTKLYGKTGTGSVDTKDVTGWFTGMAEKEDRIYYFAVNIQRDDLANGKTAFEIACQILKDKGIYT